LIIIDNDTLVLLTPIQVKKINATILRLDECRKITTSLEQENKELILKYSILNKEIENLKKQNEISDRIDLEMGNQIGILTSENKKKDKKINLLKKSRTLFTLGGIVLGSAATYFVTLL
tara:strand:- start:8505 stop:8861 length:357 start_codon:yes stop_codon:yes gene_type:complete